MEMSFLCGTFLGYVIYNNNNVEREKVICSHMLYYIILYDKTLDFNGLKLKAKGHV